MSRQTYPGVYIEEKPSGVHTVTGVATSIAAFVDFFTEGPLNRAVLLNNFGDFERTFGGLDCRSEASYGIAQFFLNGGAQALAIRVSTGQSDPTQAAQIASVVVQSADKSKDILKLAARNPGAWGNTLRVAMDLNTLPANSFNVTVARYSGTSADAKPVKIEKILNVNMDKNSSRYVVSVIKTESNLINVVRLSTDTDGTLPAATDPSGVANVTEYALGYNSPAAVAIPAETGGACLQVAAQPGLAGTLRVEILRVDAARQFQLKINQYDSSHKLVQSQTTQVTLNSALGSEAIFSKVNQGVLVQASLAPGWDQTSLPLGTGTLSGVIPTDTDFSALKDATLRVSMGATGAVFKTAKLTWGDTEDVSTLALFAPQLQKALQAADSGPAFKQATVTVFGNQLQILAGRGTAAATPGDIITFQMDGTSPAADALKLTADSQKNVQEYVLRISDPGSLKRDQVGLDGGLPEAEDLIGQDAADPSQVTGLYALKYADLFNLLCLPRAAELGDTDMDYVIGHALNYCEQRRAMLLIDLPAAVHSVQGVMDWLDRKANYRSPNTVLYYPRFQQPDPLSEFRLKSRGPSGTMAGLFARFDSTRGVWKAPAGTEAAVQGISGLDAELTDAQNGSLNPLAINAIRKFPVYGLVAWGARTLDGSDQAASDWKYIPVRRLALFLEESMFRGTKWVVFEPNDEPLWSKIRMNLNAFMMGLFRQGAFQGSTPSDAFYVKCDAETTTQDDRNHGVVNIEVGFAPLKPAEFVVLKFSQIAGNV